MPMKKTAREQGNQALDSDPSRLGITLDDAILAKLKDTPEQKLVVGPIVQYLLDLGWENEIHKEVLGVRPR
jgi:hypothetical protein